MRVFFMAKKVFVVIDGGNFYRKLINKQIGCLHPGNFDYLGFVKHLAGKERIVKIIYYVGQVREETGNEKSKELKRKQDKFLAHLENLGIMVKRGYILKSEDTYQEKGVDVQIAVDICMMAVRNEYDHLILISSDTDLIPAIKEARKLNKNIEYIGFNFSPSFALIRFSDLRTLLKKQDLEKYFKP